MRFKKLQQESERSKICYVSYATASNNFDVDCYECYKNGKICPLHQGLKPLSPKDMCNAITSFRDVSTLKLQTDFFQS